MQIVAAAREQRRTKRARVLYVARIVANVGEQQVKLLDLSPFGAQVETYLALSVDEMIDFIRSDQRVTARVVWTDGSRAGLEFVEPAYNITGR